MAVAVARDEHGVMQSTDKVRAECRTRIEQARAARKPLEPAALSNLAFAAGQHWLVWDDQAGQLVERRKVDPGFKNRDLFTANRIREYLNAQMGELSSGDDCPELTTVQQGDTAEDVAVHLNAAVGHAWENEWNADTALRRARGYSLTMGTSAVRASRDKNFGPVVGHLAYDQAGQPVTDQNELQSLEQNGQLADGSLPRFQPVNEGRTRWQPLTFFHILPQPGVTHEDDLAWFDIVRPVAIDTLIDEYGDAAAGLVEDGDIASASGVATGQQAQSGNPGGDRSRLRGHVWLHTMYDLPCRKYPNGRVTVLASNGYVLLDMREQLDYQMPDGSWHTGVVFLHWNRLDDRFFSQAFIEPLKDPQRTISEIKTAQLEIIWRGMPKVFTKEGDLPHNPTGLPLENIELRNDAAQPQFFAGMAPGSWLDTMIAACDNDLAHASTLSAMKLGENPDNVDTYSQLALLVEQEGYKRSSIMSDHEQQIGTLVKCGVYDISRYWPDGKQMLVAGDEEGSFAVETFLKQQVPTFYRVKVRKGVTLPRSQGAELKKIDAIWAAALQAGVANDPATKEKWIRWYDTSISAGQALDLPEIEQDSQERMARYENMLLLAGEQVQPAAYDLAPVHIPIHREAEDEARARGDMEAAARIEAHIQTTVQVQQANAMQIAMSQQAPSPLGPSLAAAASPAFARPDFLRLAAGN